MADTTTATPESPASKKKRTRKQLNFGLGWVTETANELDDEGNEIPGTSRKCIVMMPLPPNLDEAGARSRDAIERATKNAVYKEGLEEYGNKKLIVISYGDEFDVPFEKTTVVKLQPPKSKPEASGDDED